MSGDLWSNIRNFFDSLKEEPLFRVVPDENAPQPRRPYPARAPQGWQAPRAKQVGRRWESEARHAGQDLRAFVSRAEAQAKANVNRVVDALRQQPPVRIIPSRRAAEGEEDDQDEDNEDDEEEEEERGYRRRRRYSDFGRF